MDYHDFLTAKVDFDRSYGFTVPDDAVHPLLMPHQRDIVRWAVHGGRRAIFAAFGLGKSVMQWTLGVPLRHTCAGTPHYPKHRRPS